MSHAELTHYLREQIPDYMVPASWVELPQLPLTSSGKLDRRALPAPDQTRPELDTAYTPPRTGLEEQLSAIWCEVLGLERVGSHDDFFALGGHSLLATRVMARVSAVLQVELPLRRLFELPTIAQLAAEISARRSGETPPPSRALSATQTGATRAATAIVWPAAIVVSGAGGRSVDGVQHPLCLADSWSPE